MIRKKDKLLRNLFITLCVVVLAATIAMILQVVNKQSGFETFGTDSKTITLKKGCSDDYFLIKYG